MLGKSSTTELHSWPRLKLFIRVSEPCMRGQPVVWESGKGKLFSICTGIVSAISWGRGGVEMNLCQNFKHLNICEENGVEFQVLPLPLKPSDRKLGLPGYRGTYLPVEYLRHLTTVTVPTKAAAVYQLLT